MEIYKTKDSAEEAKRANPKHSTGDMVVKVDGGFAIMSAKEYIDWLLKQ
jgi:hypothetical protein